MNVILDHLDKLKMSSMICDKYGKIIYKNSSDYRKIVPGTRKKLFPMMSSYDIKKYEGLFETGGISAFDLFCRNQSVCGFAFVKRQFCAWYFPVSSANNLLFSSKDINENHITDVVFNARNQIIDGKIFEIPEIFAYSAVQIMKAFNLSALPLKNYLGYSLLVSNFLFGDNRIIINRADCSGLTVDCPQEAFSAIGRVCCLLEQNSDTVAEIKLDSKRILVTVGEDTIYAGNYSETNKACTVKPFNYVISDTAAALASVFSSEFLKYKAN